MRRKGIGVLLLSLWLTACGSLTPPSAANPSIDEMTKTESAFTQANLSSALASATPPLTASYRATRWRFTASQGLSLIGDPPLNLDIEPASDDKISIEVLHDSNASVKGALFDNVLSLRVSANSGSKAILYLPAKTQYLMLKTFNTIQGNPLVPLLYVNFDGCSNVNLSGTAWLLHYLRIANSAHITLSNIKTPYLLAWVTDSNTLSIRGMMNLRELNVRNSRAVEFYWLNSPILTSTIDDGAVILSGDVAYANMNATSHTQLDTKYLTTHRLFIHTADQATAEVRAVDALNALAAGQSNIYYYTQPTTLSRYYRDQGSVLYMGEKPPICQLPYCVMPPRVLPG